MPLFSANSNFSPPADLLITWAWGGEKDVSNRLVYRGMFLSCPSTVFGRCGKIWHKTDHRHEPYPEGFDRLAHTMQMVHLDDFSSLIYQVLDKHKYLLHSKLTVDVGTPHKQSWEMTRNLLGYVSVVLVSGLPMQTPFPKALMNRILSPQLGSGLDVWQCKNCQPSWFLGQGHSVTQCKR